MFFPDEAWTEMVWQPFLKKHLKRFFWVSLFGIGLMGVHYWLNWSYLNGSLSRTQVILAWRVIQAGAVGCILWTLVLIYKFHQEEKQMDFLFLNSRMSEKNEK